MERTGDEPPDDEAAQMNLAEARRRQSLYAASRRDWAERVGRPYQDQPDPRPPPGELDAAVEE